MTVKESTSGVGPTLYVTAVNDAVDCSRELDFAVYNDLLLFDNDMICQLQLTFHRWHGVVWQMGGGCVQTAWHHYLIWRVRLAY